MSLQIPNDFAVIKKSPSDSFRIRYLARFSHKCLLSRFLYSSQMWYINTIFFCDMLSVLHLSMPYLTVSLKFIKYSFTSPPIFKPLSTPHFFFNTPFLLRTMFLDLCFTLGPAASELPSLSKVLYSEFVTAMPQDFKSIAADGFCLLKHLPYRF